MRDTLALGLATLLVILPQFASAASLMLDTDAQTYGVGDTFIATIRVDNGDTCINAIEGEVDYPTDILRAVDFSRGDSILSLWISDPKIDAEKGTVSFAGGVPGGYCGHIAGDQSPSDIVGKIVFTVIGDRKPSAEMNLALASRVYLHDGSGTPAELSLRGRTVAIVDKPTLSENPWLAEVGDDKTPPEPFSIDVNSTRDVFGGKYFAVFSTTDKQSGMDHFEIFEDGIWKPVASPRVLKDQSLAGGVKIRAIDKAGNMREGDFDPTSVPPRQYTIAEYVSLIGLLVIAAIAILVRLYLARRARREREARG